MMPQQMQSRGEVPTEGMLLTIQPWTTTIRHEVHTAISHLPNACTLLSYCLVEHDGYSAAHAKCTA